MVNYRNSKNARHKSKQKVDIDPVINVLHGDINISEAEESISEIFIRNFRGTGGIR